MLPIHWSVSNYVRVRICCIPFVNHARARGFVLSRCRYSIWLEKRCPIFGRIVDWEQSGFARRHFRTAALLLADSFVRNVLLFISATYLLFLAGKVAFAGSKVAFIHMTAPGLVSANTLQLINPKAYAVHTTLFSGFVIYPESFVIETGIKLTLSNLI